MNVLQLLNNNIINCKTNKILDSIVEIGWVIYSLPMHTIGFWSIFNVAFPLTNMVAPKLSVYCLI